MAEGSAFFQTRAALAAGSGQNQLVGLAAALGAESDIGIIENGTALIADDVFGGSRCGSCRCSTGSQTSKGRATTHQVGKQHHLHQVVLLGVAVTVAECEKHHHVGSAVGVGKHAAQIAVLGHHQHRQECTQAVEGVGGDVVQREFAGIAALSPLHHTDSGQDLVTNAFLGSRVGQGLGVESHNLGVHGHVGDKAFLGIDLTDLAVGSTDQMNGLGCGVERLDVMVLAIDLDQIADGQVCIRKQDDREVTKLHIGHVLAGAGSLIEDIPVTVGGVANSDAHHGGADVGILGKADFEVHTEEFLVGTHN